MDGSSHLFCGVLGLLAVYLADGEVAWQRPLGDGDRQKAALGVFVNDIIINANPVIIKLYCHRGTYR